jgi:hypothetical protein
VGDARRRGVVGVYYRLSDTWSPVLKEFVQRVSTDRKDWESEVFEKVASSCVEGVI